VTSADTIRYRVTQITEPFRHYHGDWGATSGRTDTPNLMEIFSEAEEEALLVEGSREMAGESLALAEANLHASAETLPIDDAQ
jgi:hypothetical protein